MSYQADPDPVCECPVCHWKDSLSLAITHQDLPHCPRCLRPVEVLIPPQRIVGRVASDYDLNADTR